MRGSLGNEKGQALMQVLVASAIMGIIMMAVASTIQTQNTEAAALRQKLAGLEVKTLIQSILADGTVCKYQLATVAPQSITLAKVKSNSYEIPIVKLPASGTAQGVANPVLQTTVGSNNATPSDPTLLVTKIAFDNFTEIPGAPLSYKTQLSITFDETKLVRTMRPITVPLTIQTDASGKVINCNGGGPAPGTVGAPCGPPDNHGITQYVSGSNIRLCCGISSYQSVPGIYAYVACNPY